MAVNDFAFHQPEAESLFCGRGCRFRYFRESPKVVRLWQAQGDTESVPTRPDASWRVYRAARAILRGARLKHF
jgi:hypothetical protein